jgi:hypothetical protein
MSNARKLTVIALISLLVSVALLGSGWITQTVSAIDLDEAIDLEAAPHFRDLTYTVGAPSYSTAFDELGSWKVSVGNPKLSIDSSNLVITSPSASGVRMTLTAADAGINETERSTIQIKVAPGNVTAQYTNVTLAANTDASDLMAVSFYGGEAKVVYSNGASTASSVLYSPVKGGASYVIAFELAESGTTVYLYDSAGDLLANKLLDVSDVHAGSVYAMHIGVSGLASGTVRADYAFVSTDVTDRAGSEIEMAALETDSSSPAKTVEVDPTKLKMIRSDDSITSGAYGMDALAGAEDDEVANMFGTIGSTAEPSQRFKGQFVAVGWEDFRSSVESQLQSQIAKSLGILDSKTIYIVDYYIDYLQLKTGLDQTVVNNEMAEYRQAMADVFQNMGIDLNATDSAVLTRQYTSVPMVSYGSSTMAILPPGANVNKLDEIDFLASLNPVTMAWNYWSMTPEERAEYNAKASAVLTEGAVDVDIPQSLPDALGLPDKDDAEELVMDLVGELNATLVAMADNTLDAINAGWAGAIELCNMTYLNLYNSFDNEIDRWQAVLNSTMEQFATMSKETLAAMTGFFDSTVDGITSGYEDMNNRLTSLNAEYMNWSNAMMVNTNAMFTQMFYDLSEQSAETQRYFMDQVTKGNEAVANISDSIALSASQTNEIFADLLSGGKLTEDSGLSFGAFLGDESTTVTIVLVVIISLVAVVVIFLLMGQKKKAGRQRR